ncbi:MAG: amidohydrolase [bacterium]
MKRTVAHGRLLVAKADLILTNARILTMDDRNPRAARIAVAGDVILAVDNSAENHDLVGPGTRVIDLGGATVMPGFIDSHCHLFLGGAEMDDLPLSGVMGFERLCDLVRAFAVARPGKGLLVGQGADYAILDHEVRRQDLDAIMPDRPFAMMAADHHTVWANTAALKAGNVLRGATLPAGAKVVMAEDGLASGVLLEPAAFNPVLALAGKARASLGLTTGGEPDLEPSANERAADLAMLASAAAHLAAQGITSVVNMDGNLYMLSLLQELLDIGRLPLRVQVAFHFRPEMSIAMLEKASAMARDWQGDVLRAGLVKLFMDGVMEGGTAWMLEDYPGRPGQRGAALFDPARFAEIAVEADRRGLQIAVHAIGDAAVRTVIDGYAAARSANGTRDSRHRIEHIELIHPEDLPRLRELGIVGSLQPAHVPGAMDVPLLPSTDCIPHGRWADAFRCRSLNVPLAFGSDWPVADVSVLRAIKAAVTRTPWAMGLPDERLGLAETLAAYTRGGAWASHSEARTGMLRAGLLADIVVLGGNIEDVPPAAIDSPGVAMTICGGRITHERST